MRSSESPRSLSHEKYMQSRGEIRMKRYSRQWGAMLVLIPDCLLMCPSLLLTQTLGTAPMFNRAVLGQTGAQPEGAFFNFINWIGNVVAPVAAGGAVFGGVVCYL